MSTVARLLLKRLRFPKAWIIFVCLLGLSVSAQAPLDIRVALVIGNSAYVGAPLPNPVNDARAMAEVLRGLGFAVTELQDASRTQMSEAIARVRETLRGKQAVGMLYYAGHGLQLDWRNYMVPVDARIGSAADVPAQTVDVNSVIEAFRAAGNRMNILVLDACRDNPFGNIASGKGLAQLDAPPGTFLAYATAPGNVAEDGDARTGNGLYTQFLLQELKKPTTRIEDVFKRVRLQVRQRSQGRQIPWESTSLEDDFVFNSGAKPVAAPSERERARAFAQQKEEWDKIKDSRNPDDFYAFLVKYPNGDISEIAQGHLQRIQKAQIAAIPNKDGIAQVEGMARFRLGDTVEYAILDAYSKVQTGRERLVVTKIAADRVETNDGDGAVYTPEGGTIKSRVNPGFDPPRQDLPAGDYSVGKKWTFQGTTRFTDGQSSFYSGKAEVAALEDVTVPAGTFRAFRIEMVQTNTRRTTKVTLWVQPDWGFPIKVVQYPTRVGTSQFAEIREMISRRFGNS
jgi:hypothetical protein